MQQQQQARKSKSHRSVPARDECLSQVEISRANNDEFSKVESGLGLSSDVVLDLVYL
jgi:hypothetical protein